MFGIKHNECVGFESRWQVKKVTSEGTSQTTEFSTKETASTTTETCSIETQTENTQASNISSDDVEMDRLAEWLNKIYPSVHKELDKSAKSKVFRGYRLENDSDITENKLLQVFNVSNTSESGDNIRRKVSSMSWNCTGKTLAVSCNYEHENWCHHTGSVVLYGLSSFEKFSDVPKRKITTDSCVTCLKFHPTQPAILAASDFAGHILIWNLINEQENETYIKINAHDEYITQISWIDDIDDSRNVLLASSSIDTFLKIWNLDSHKNNLVLQARYKIKPPLLASGQSISEDTKKFKVDRAVTCFDFSKHIPDIFLVALEGGLLVHCSLLGTSELKGGTQDSPLLDPVFKYFESHSSEIKCVKFSPNRNDMFLSCGVDTEVRIYLTEQDEPAQILFVKNPLNDISWVLYEEKLLSACGKEGEILVFNVKTGQLIEDVMTADKIDKNVLTCMNINEKKPSLVAIGDVQGNLQLWNIPWQVYLKE